MIGIQRRRAIQRRRSRRTRWDERRAGGDSKAALLMQPAEALEEVAEVAVGRLNLLPLARALQDLEDEILILDVEELLDKVAVDEAGARARADVGPVRTPVGMLNAAKAMDDAGHVALQVKERVRCLGAEEVGENRDPARRGSKHEVGRRVRVQLLLLLGSEGA
jgi:hypothetical protein